MPTVNEFPEANWMVLRSDRRRERFLETTEPAEDA